MLLSKNDDSGYLIQQGIQILRVTFPCFFCSCTISHNSDGPIKTKLKPLVCKLSRWRFSSASHFSKVTFNKLLTQDNNIWARILFALKKG